jgi:hypothetical protein
MQRELFIGGEKLERKIAISALLIMACILIPVIVQPAQSATSAEDPVWAGAAAYADAFPAPGVLAGPIGTIGPCPGFAGAFALATEWAGWNLAIGYGSGSAFCCSNGWNILVASAFAMVVGRGVAWGVGWAVCQCTVVTVKHRFGFNIGIMLKVHGNAIAEFNYTISVEGQADKRGTATFDGTTVVLKEWDGTHYVPATAWIGIPWEIVSGMPMAIWPRTCQKKYYDVAPLASNLLSNFTVGSRVESFDDNSWACARNDIPPISSPYTTYVPTGHSEYSEP